jgi:thiol-disulfide isomerase/thioredoxin
MRRSFVALLAALLLMTAGSCSNGGGGNGSKALNANFDRLTGGQTSFAAFRGKPLVVNFFSSTCVPCQTEMPAFEQIHQELADRVTFVGLDVQDTVAAGQAFVAAVKVTWELGRDPDAAILQSLGGVGLPTTLLADRDGRVVFTHLGALPADELRRELSKRGFA